jgi:putative DNA primase/helicase
MTIPAKLPFDQVNRTALGQYPDILFQWFPNGTLVDGKREFAIGNLNGDAGGKKGGSVKVNLKTGEWAEMNGGEPNGGDPISLYAWAFCGGKMGDACREMGASLGVPGCTAPRDSKVLPFVPKNPPREAEAKAKWEPLVPPPDTIGEPKGMLADWDHVYRYYNRAGRLLRFVVRNDAKGDEPKKILPLTYGLKNGKASWQYKHPDAPRGLYGLERLDGRPVLLQEGEGKTDAVQALCPDLACLSLTGGTGNKNCQDLKPLGGLNVVCCPDADKGGRDTMAEIADQLRAIGANARLIDHPADTPLKWDLGNAVKDGWTGSDILEYMRVRAVDRFEDTPDLGDSSTEPGPDEDDLEPIDTRRKRPPLPLGQDEGVYYYLSPMTNQIKALTENQHTKLFLMALADKRGYWEKTAYMGEKGVSWEDAAADLMAFCSGQGIFSDEKIRGRGAWMDAGRAILHLGESLIIDGVWQRSLRVPNSVYIYTAAKRLNQVNAAPLPISEANKVREMCGLLRWEKPISATLAAGWIAIASICGALKWRPHIWVTGGSGSGKTTFVEDIAGKVLEGVAAPFNSKTSEAGIRQRLRKDARPILFDEAEAESAADKTRMQGNIDLARQSSSESGAEIVKGTQSQTGAKSYKIRSCFMFTSINVGMSHQADETRITVLELFNPPDGENEKDGANYAKLLTMMLNTTQNPEWCAGFIARSVRLMPTIIKNAATFKAAVALKFKSNRIGDQLGTLLAGAFSLTSNAEITLEQAKEYLDRKEHDWAGATSAEAERDEVRLINHLMEWRTRASGIDVTLGDLVQIMTGKEGPVTEGQAKAELERHGIKFVPANLMNKTPAGIYILNGHSRLSEYVLKNTPWASQWGRALKRLPGAENPKRNIRVGFRSCGATFIPLTTLIGGV